MVSGISTTADEAGYQDKHVTLVRVSSRPFIARLPLTQAALSYPPMT